MYVHIVKIKWMSMAGLDFKPKLVLDQSST